MLRNLVGGVLSVASWKNIFLNSIAPFPSCRPYTLPLDCLLLQA